MVFVGRAAGKNVVGRLGREIGERQRVVLIGDGAGESCLRREMGRGVDGKLCRRRGSIKRLTDASDRAGDMDRLALVLGLHVERQRVVPVCGAPRHGIGAGCGREFGERQGLVFVVVEGGAGKGVVAGTPP